MMGSNKEEIPEPHCPSTPTRSHLSDFTPPDQLDECSPYIHCLADDALVSIEILQPAEVLTDLRIVARYSGLYELVAAS